MATHDQHLAHQTGRGRDATAPTQIPVKGWKDILFRTFKEVGQDRVTLIAAGATYFMLLAIFPTLTAIVSIYGLIVSPETVQQHVAILTNVLPAGGASIVEEQLSRLTSQETPTLGFALAISVGLALWSSSSGVKSLFEAMNIAYDEEEKRNFFKLNLTALLFTLAGVVGAVVMIGVVVALPAVLGFIGLGTGLEWLAQIGGYVLLAAVLLAGLAALYRFGPSRARAKWRWITPGAILAALIVLVVSGLFSWYTANFANYEKTYGSLGALIGFLTWMWICLTAVIIGAELNSEVEHQTARDSTVGTEEPLGQRNATMADTVGEDTSHENEDDRKAMEGKSHDWQEGYRAGLREQSPARRKLPLAAAVPAALVMSALEKRSDRR